MKNQSNQEKVKEILNEINAKLEDLISKSKDVKDELSEELGKKIEEFKAKKNKLEEEIRTNPKYNDSLQHLKNAFDEFKKAISTLIK